MEKGPSVRTKWDQGQLTDLDTRQVCFSVLRPVDLAQKVICLLGGTGRWALVGHQVQ